MMEEQAAAEASHSVYTKPVALYNILRQRAVTNPLFLQRCLHYKLQAKLDKRIQISVSTSGATTTNDGLQIQTLFPLYVLLARPVSTTNVETQSTAVYRFNRARKLTVFGGAETATFILPEMNKLLKQIKSGSLEMLLVSCADSSNSQNIDLTEDHMLSNLLNGMDYCLFGKIPMDSLHSSWEKAPPLSLGGRSEMKSDVNMKPCSMKLSSIGREKCLSFQFPYNSEAVSILQQIPVDIFTEECRPKNIFQPDAYSFKDTHGPGSMRLGSGNVIFNYTYWNTALYRTEVTKDFSCPFCLAKCSNMKGLKCHLISSHDLFEFVFYVYEDNQGVIVYAKSDVNSSEFCLTIPDGVDPKQQLFSYCHKSRRRRKPKWQTPNANNVHLLVLDSTMSTALTGHIDSTDGVPDNMEIDVCSPDASATCPSLAGLEPVQSVPESNLAPPTMRQSNSRNRALLEKRQFFHSRSGQPMDLEQVFADRDSEDEVDDDVADLEDRRMLDDFVDVSKDEKQMMHLWNSFVRKQRVLADGHISWACEAFSKLHGPDLVQAPSVLWCWRLFMIKIWNHGLLDSKTLNNCGVILEQYQSQSQSQNQDQNQSQDVDAMKVDE